MRSHIYEFHEFVAFIRSSVEYGTNIACYVNGSQSTVFAAERMITEIRSEGILLKHSDFFVDFFTYVQRVLGIPSYERFLEGDFHSAIRLRNSMAASHSNGPQETLSESFKERMSVPLEMLRFLEIFTSEKSTDSPIFSTSTEGTFRIVIVDMVVRLRIPETLYGMSCKVKACQIHKTIVPKRKKNKEKTPKNKAEERLYAAMRRSVSSTARFVAAVLAVASFTRSSSSVSTRMTGTSR
ncbi:MAG: hypothetical protein QG650_947 [Patescibacteria group bacterium]|nr:hypothetical protein [Patescibacteria group bacterium]